MVDREVLMDRHQHGPGERNIHPAADAPGGKRHVGRVKSGDAL